MTRMTSTRFAGLVVPLAPILAVATALASDRKPIPLADEQMSPLRMEIDISERTLYVGHGDALDAYPVAVGMPEYPTPTGHFSITQVTWNPDWRPPPNSEWSEDEEYMEPDHPDNPMGKVKIMWKAPDYTIHGTDALESLGTNESHGSIRMANEEIVRLARRVMAHGRVAKSEEWYEMAVRNDSDQHVVELSNTIPIHVHE